MIFSINIINISNTKLH